jgi:hypothetical protein
MMNCSVSRVGAVPQRLAGGQDRELLGNDDAGVLIGRRPQGHCRWFAGQASKGYLHDLCVAFPRRIVALLIEDAYVDDLAGRTLEPIVKFVAAAPLNGELMMRIRAVVDHRNDDLILLWVVVHRPKGVRHRGVVGRYHHEHKCNQ